MMVVHDKVLKKLNDSIVVIEDFADFPQITLNNGKIAFSNKGNTRGILDVCDSKANYFNARLALAEERVFSNTNKYARAKLSQGDSTSKIVTVHNVHSVMGSTAPKWVLGLITQREDAKYYLEDSTLSVKISFTELKYADPDAYFTENCIILCYGLFQNEVFMIYQLESPPLHHRKQFTFKLNESDYFGSYTRKQQLIAEQHL